MSNLNPKTGVVYGYISANALHPEVADTLLFGPQAVNNTERQALIDELRDHIDGKYSEEQAEYLKSGLPTNTSDESMDIIDFIGDLLRWEAEDAYIGEFDEPCITGCYQGVNYATSYLGGALNFFILESPVETDKARRASPCVPGAAILDTLDGDVSGYDVPTNWRSESDYC